MEVQVNTVYQKQIYETRIKYPSWTQQEIAKHLDVSQPLVSRVLKKARKAITISVPQKIREKALVEMEEAAFAFQMYLTELEDLKSSKKPAYKKDEETGELYASMIPLDANDKINIIKTQSDIRTQLVELRSLKEPIEVLDWLEKNKHQLNKITK